MNINFEPEEKFLVVYIRVITDYSCCFLSVSQPLLLYSTAVRMAVCSVYNRLYCVSDR